jgi:hypothetical protein
MSPLQHLTSLLRGRPRIDPAELGRYASAIRPPAERLGGLYARWRRDLEVDSKAEEHANAASIQRWEAAAVRDQLAAVPPPAPLAKLHAELAALADETARAAQLMSNGFRFHNSDARCDGHALMLASEERFASLRRALERQGVSVAPAAPDGVEPIR